MLLRSGVQLGLAGLVVAAPGAFAQTTVPAAFQAPMVSPALRAASDRLAAIVNPDSIVENQVDRLAETLLGAMFASGTDLAKMEVTYPGLRDALGASIKPVMAKYSLRAMPLYRAELSQLYQSRLTVSELNHAADFFVSPVMVKFIASARANMDMKNMVKSMVAETEATTVDIRRDMGTAGAKTVLALSPAEQDLLVAFFASPVGVKLNALRDEKLAIDTKWANYTDPQVETEVEALVVNAMVSHIALTDPEVAEAIQEELAKPQAETKQ